MSSMESSEYFNLLRHAEYLKNNSVLAEDPPSPVAAPEAQSSKYIIYFLHLLVSSRDLAKRFSITLSPEGLLC